MHPTRPHVSTATQGAPFDPLSTRIVRDIPNISQIHRHKNMRRWAWVSLGRRRRRRCCRRTRCGRPAERSRCCTSGGPRLPIGAVASRRQFGILAPQVGRWSAHGTKDALRRSPACSPRCPPNGDAMRARLPVCSPLRPQTPAGSPIVPASVHLVVPRTWPRGPETGAVHLVVPGPTHAGHGEEGRAVVGAGGPSGLARKSL
jgi:hypothetical protein